MRETSGAGVEGLGIGETSDSTPLVARGVPSLDRRAAAIWSLVPAPQTLIGYRVSPSEIIAMTHPNSFNARATLDVGGRKYTYFRLDALSDVSGGNAERLPVSLRILLENLLRNEDGAFVKREDVEAMARWKMAERAEKEIAFRTARVLLQDFTGVPAVVDLAAMRDAIARLGGDAQRINPLQPVDLVIDHSVQVDEYGTDAAFLLNIEKDFERNLERYQFLRWGSDAFENFRVVPPGTGICHQVNLEYLGQVVFTSTHEGEAIAYPDSLVG